MHQFVNLLLLLWLHSSTQAVDRSKFKSCTTSGFCKRHRAVKEATGYVVDPSTVVFNETSLTAKLKNDDNKLRLDIVALQGSTVRFFIDDASEAPLKKRFHPVDVFAESQPVQQKLSRHESDDKSATFFTLDKNKVVLHYSPFRVDVFSGERIVLSLNSRELLKFEHFRRGRRPKKDGEGFWEEDFGEARDLKPWGSSSVGIDLSFIGYKWIFGIPEHADGFSLRTTYDYEPYRLYNLDVFEYDVSSPMALYGSVPYLTTVAKDSSIGVLWLNPSETWIDVNTTLAVYGKHADLITKDDPAAAAKTPQIDTRIFSESGFIDIFVFLGPRPADVVRQHSAVTGVYPLPPMFALAYHQSRWNYEDQKDVKMVSDKFEEAEIPLDVIWLDIEHTDEKKYFTWDKQKFPDPKAMIEDLTEKGRKLVTIVDPHIAKDKKFGVYNEAQKRRLWVKDSDLKDYIGNCWPGDSKYIDFVNPDAREFWADLFSLDKYNGTTNDVHIWNDMNEPSVFSGPEITMHKDAIHHGGFEHREVHNLYGFYQTMATFEGLKRRSDNTLRPFVLSRSFFAGSQRYTAVWTGDNRADWSHLKVSIPMLLSLSIAGIPHVGADVGGFFGDPDEELLIRWYQAAAFQPFFRGHAHKDSKRREPYLFTANTTESIRKAIKRRYELLPYWYTLFYEHTLTGKPPMRPLFMEMPEDETCYDEDREFMVGNALLVRPVMEAGLENISLYLPGRREVWYEWDTHKARPSPGAVQLPSPIDKIPVFQRGGTIIATREDAQSSSATMKDGPVTLYVAVNSKGDHANGTMYIDDEESYEYKNGNFAYWGFFFKKEHDYLHTITNKIIDKKGTLDSEIVIDRIIVRGAKFYPRTAHIYLDGEKFADFTPDPLEIEYDKKTHHLVINSPNAFVTSEFRIDLHT